MISYIFKISDVVRLLNSYDASKTYINITIYVYEKFCFQIQGNNFLKRIKSLVLVVYVQFLNEGEEHLRMTHLLQPPSCGEMLCTNILWMHVLFNPAIVYFLPFKTETYKKRDNINMHTFFF